MDYANAFPFMQLPLRTALVLDTKTKRSFTLVNERVITRGYILTSTEDNPGEYGVLRSPTTEQVPAGVPPAVDGVPPLLLVHTTTTRTPNAAPWRELGWQAIIFLRSSEPLRDAISPETIDSLLLTEHHFKLSFRNRNSHLSQFDSLHKQHLAYKRILRRMMRRNIHAARDVFHHAKGFHTFGTVPRSLIPEICTLQRTFPHDALIARSIVLHYGAKSHKHAAGIMAIHCLQRSSKQTDRILLALYKYDSSVSTTTIRGAVQRDPATFFIPKIKHLFAEGKFHEALRIAKRVHASHDDSRLRVVATRIARDAAWHAGEFETAHTYGTKVLTDRSAAQLLHWRNRERDIEHVTESAAHVSGDIAQLLAMYPYTDPGIVGRYARESLEYHAVIRKGGSIFREAHNMMKKPRSLLRLHYLARTEAHAPAMRRFTTKFQDAVRQAPSGVRQWFATSFERNAQKSVPTPGEKPMGSRIMTLHVGARLQHADKRRTIRLQAATTAQHLHGTQRLTTRLGKGSDTHSLRSYNTPLTTEATLHLTVFGQPTGVIGSEKLPLGNRELEFLILLTFYPRGILEGEVAQHLSDGEVAPGFVRSLAATMREYIAISHSPYRITMPVTTDYQAFTEAHAMEDYEAMLRAYSHVVFPQSRAPFIQQLRRETLEAMQEAIAQIDDADLLIEQQAKFTEHPWYVQRLDALLDSDDPRRQLIGATEEQQGPDGPGVTVPAGSS